MIQRIQTLYLIISLVIISLLLIFPYGFFKGADEGVYQLVHGGMIKISNNIVSPVYYNYSITILCAIAISLIIYTIAYYKNRNKQISFCRWIIYLFIIMTCSLFWIYFRATSSFLFSRINWVIFAPALDILPVFLAIRAIKNDEYLVKSADRLR
jgi:hypothetical protein